MRGRQIFRGLTIVLFVLTAWTVYANVLSDDTEVRALALTALGRAAGCGEACKVESLRGERGMFGETIAYDVVRKGPFTVVCRREYLSAGSWSCAAK